MDAKVKNGIAILEEFLQEKYVENYDELDKYESKVEGLSNLYSEYFYIPANENIGSLRYVIDSEGHALFLINKSGLPKEIRESLVGGEAGNKTYSDYQSLNDVYGVTKDLKVYYCSNGSDSIYGIGKNELDDDDKNREVFSKEDNPEIYKLLEKYDGKGNVENKDGILSADEVKGPKDLTITKEDGINSLKDLYNLLNLQQLILDGVTLDNLDGVENVSLLNYIYFKNCNIGNYSAIGRMTRKLEYLYFYDVNNEEMEKACSKDRGIGGKDFEKLQYFAVVGEETYINSSENVYKENRTATKYIENLNFFDNLTLNTKNKIKYLSLQCNEITSIKNLKDFNNLYLLRVEGNKLQTLDGLKDLRPSEGNKGLTYLYSNSNLLGNGEVISSDLPNEGKNELTDALSSLSNKTNLYYLRLTGNENLRWIEYIEDLSNIRYLYLDGCTNLANVSSLKGVLGNCGINQAVDTKYKFDVLDSNTRLLDLSNETIKLSTFQSLSDCIHMNKLSLENIVLTHEDESVITGEDLTDDGKPLINTEINKLLSGFKEMNYLKLKGIENLTTIDFVGPGKEESLIELDLKGTKVSDITILNEYGKSLRTLILDYDKTDLSGMATCFNHLTSGGWWGNNGGWYEGVYTSLILDSQTLCNNISTCIGLATFETLGLNSEYTVDLTECSSLKVVYRLGGSKLKLPENLEQLCLVWGGVENVIMESDVFVDYLYMESCNASNVSGKAKIHPVSIRISECSGFNDFSSLTNFGIDISRVTSFSFSFWSQDRNTRVSGLENFPNLNYLDISNLNFMEMNYVENMTNLETLISINSCITDISKVSSLNNLTKIVLSGNEITDLSPLKNLKKLNYLDLESNSLDDNTIVLVGEKEERYTNLDIIARLNPINGGRLTEVYLAGNPGIINFSKLSGLSWTKKSGF